MAMKFAAIIKHLMGFIEQVTDHKYSVAVLLCDRGVVCATCRFHRPGHILHCYQVFCIV